MEQNLAQGMKTCDKIHRNIRKSLEKAIIVSKFVAKFDAPTRSLTHRLFSIKSTCNYFHASLQIPNIPFKIPFHFCRLLFFNFLDFKSICSLKKIQHVTPEESEKNQ